LASFSLPAPFFFPEGFLLLAIIIPLCKVVESLTYIITHLRVVVKGVRHFSWMVSRTI
jgi:hypothetical protein